jgi:mannitol-1-phosphate/altronate dehydrogenase
MALAERHGAELVRYVEGCTFPNSMVDRITPQTKDRDRKWLQDEVGIDDAWPVVCELFRQWVVEDRFAAGRPRWEEAGALFSDRRARLGALQASDAEREPFVHRLSDGARRRRLRG